MWGKEATASEPAVVGVEEQLRAKEKALNQAFNGVQAAEKAMN